MGNRGHTASSAAWKPYSHLACSNGRNVRTNPAYMEPFTEHGRVRKSHFVRINIVATLLVTTAVGVGAQPAQAGGDIRMIMNKLSGKCLAAADGPDYRVTQATCRAADERQLWNFDGEHEDQQFVNVATKRCLTVFGHSDGQQVHAAACDLADVSNHWTWVWTEDDRAFGLEPIDLRGFCLDLHPDNVIGLWKCKDTDFTNQYWIFKSHP